MDDLMNDANPGIMHRINTALYDEKTATAADSIPANPLHAIVHPIETNKAVWDADKEAVSSIMEKLGLKQNGGGRGL